MVLVAHWRGASFKIGNVSGFVANDEGTFELACVAGIDAEISGQLHRAANALGDIDKRAIGEDGRVEGCKIVVAVGHHASEVFAHQFGVFAHGFTETAKDDTLFLQTFLEGGLHRNRVHHCIHCHSGQCHALFKGYAELVKGFHQLGVDFFLPFAFFLLGGVGVIGYGLIVDGRQVDMRPVRLFQREPMAISSQTEVQQPIRLFLFLRDESDDIFVQTGFDDVGLHICSKAVLIFLFGHRTHETVFLLCGSGVRKCGGCIF